MSIATRVGGAILVTTNRRHFLVGEPKRPIRWSEEGFVRPPDGVLDRGVSWVEIHRDSEAPDWEPDTNSTALCFPNDGEQAAAWLHQAMTIRRNGSVSERLWDLVEEHSQVLQANPSVLNAAWLAALPAPIWQIVREAVLTCS